MKFLAIPEAKLRERVAALARFLEDFELPAELGGDDPGCDVVDGAIRFITWKRSELEASLSWLDKKQQTINSLRSPGDSGKEPTLRIAEALERIATAAERSTGIDYARTLEDENEALRNNSARMFRDRIRGERLDLEVSKGPTGKGGA